MLGEGPLCHSDRHSNACRPITYLCFKTAEELILSTVGSVCFSLVVFYCCQMQVTSLPRCIVVCN